MKQAHCRPARLLRHLRHGRGMARRAFPAATLQAIAANICIGEQAHRAQVRLVVEAALSLDAVWRGDSERARAHALFARYRIWDTEENCGVLVYVNLAGRKVEIVADRGVERLVTREQWQQVCSIMAAGYAQRDYHHGTLRALDQLHALLAQVMPRQPGAPDDNELSDKPLLL